MGNQNNDDEEILPVECSTCEYYYMDSTCWIKDSYTPLHGYCKEWRLAEDLAL